MSKHSNRSTYPHSPITITPHHFHNPYASHFVKKPFSIYTSERSLVADELRAHHSAWIEVLLPSEDDFGENVECEIVEGAYIDLPILGDEYGVRFWRNEIGEFAFIHFIMNLQETGNVRLLVQKDTNSFYISTEADKNTVTTAAVTAMQDCMQKFGLQWTF